MTADAAVPASDAHAALADFLAERSGIDALLIDTVVELSKEVETLRARLDVLQDRLLAGERRLDAAPARTAPPAHPDEPASWEHLVQLSDEEWLETLLASVDGEHPHGVLPGFPSAQDQASYIGYSGKEALQDGYRFYLHMRESVQAYGTLLGEETRILDFGVGWGRHARMWLRDVLGANLTLADSAAKAIQTCAAIGMPGTGVLIADLPPSQLPEAHFDLAYAYSVFSHLSPRSHTAWAREWARVIKPGGLAIITTEGRWFLDYVRMLHDDPSQRVSVWHEKIAHGFGSDFDALRQAYDRGEFLFADNFTDQWAGLYGDAIVPQSWIRQVWGDDFELVEWVADSTRFDQAVAVLKRR